MCRKNKDGLPLKNNISVPDIQDKSGQCHTEEQYSQQVDRIFAQNYTTMRVMVTIKFWTAISPKKKIEPILREELEIAVVALKKVKSARVHNIPEELV